MKGILSVLVCILALASTLSGEMREWTSSVGTKLEAKFVKLERETITLEKADGSALQLKLSQLSEADRRFAQTQGSETDLPELNAEAGKFSEEIKCAADEEWSYYLYLPEQFHTGRKWPICFVMDPGGASPGSLERYTAAANEYGIIIAGSRQSRNRFDQAYDAMDAMVEDVFARVPVMEDFAMSSGMSGGSRMAMALSERIDLVGVIACGAGGGIYPDEGAFRSANIPRGLSVASLMGTNCFNRAEALRSHAGLYSERSSRLIWFAGNHDWAPSEVIFEGVTHVYANTLIEAKGDQYESLKSDFFTAQLAFARESLAEQPWETIRKISLMRKLATSSSQEEELEVLLKKAEEDPRTERYLEAEEELMEIAQKHIKGPNTVDDDLNPTLKKDADELAEKYKDLPIAEVIRLVGEPCKPV